MIDLTQLTSPAESYWRAAGRSAVPSNESVRRWSDTQATAGREADLNFELQTGSAYAAEFDGPLARDLGLGEFDKASSRVQSTVTLGNVMSLYSGPAYLT